jgi:hypothetical protein
MSEIFRRWPPLVRIPLFYGLIAAVLGPIIYIALYYIGDHPATIFPLFDFRILLLGVMYYFCLKELREYYFGGYLYFWQGMIACLVVTMVFAAVASIGIYLFARYNTEFISSFIQLETKKLDSVSAEDIAKIGKDTYNGFRESLQQVDAAFMARRYFIQSFGISFFISIIISVILRRQEAAV